MRIDLSAPEAAKFKNLIEKDAVLKSLKTLTPAQIDTWVNDNVVTVGNNKVLFKRILKVLAYIIRKETT